MTGAGKHGGRAAGAPTGSALPGPAHAPTFFSAPPPSAQAPALAQTPSPHPQQELHSFPAPPHTPASSSLLKGSPACRGVLIPQPASKAAPGMASSVMTVYQLRAHARHHVLTRWAGQALTPAPTAHILVPGEASCFNQMEQPLFLIIALWAPSQAAFILQDPAPKQSSLSSDNARRECPLGTVLEAGVQAGCESDS